MLGHAWPDPALVVEVPAIVYANGEVTPETLVPGAVIYRYTAPVPYKPELLRTEVPCCPDLSLDFPVATEAESRAVYQACRLVYRIEAREDVDGGHWAVFVLEGPISIARPRRYRRSGTVLNQTADLTPKSL